MSGPFRNWVKVRFITGFVFDYAYWVEWKKGGALLYPAQPEKPKKPTKRRK